MVVGGVLAGLRATGTTWRDQRIVLAGAGAAGLGIARLLRLAMREDGLTPDEIATRVVSVDSRGLVHDGRPDLDGPKRALALPAAEADRLGLGDRDGRPADLERVARALGATILVGTTGVAGTFPEPVIRAVAAATASPIVLPLSNPAWVTEATPADVLAWSDGRALVATGSPFAPVVAPDGPREVAQANNVFVFRASVSGRWSRRRAR